MQAIYVFKGPKSAKENWTECESVLLAYPSVHAALHITECELFPSTQCAICKSCMYRGCCWPCVP